MQNNKLIVTLICLVSLLGISGCASQTNKDPLEGINRGIYKFNDVTDRAVIKPIAKGYSKITPTPIRKGISNFFSNLTSITTIINDLLQLKFANAFTDAGRFVINTTFGLGGFIDVASMDNIPKHTEDFGQTLGYWGVGTGPYIVIPILGPSDLRDLTGFTIDTLTTDPIQWVHYAGDVKLSNQLRAAQIISLRSELLNAVDLIDEASLDPYAFMRDGYLQRRNFQVLDGNMQTEDDEFSDEYTK